MIERYPQFDHDGFEVSINESAIGRGYLVARYSRRGSLNFLNKSGAWAIWVGTDDGSQYHYDSVDDAIVTLSEAVHGVHEEWNDHE